MRVIAKKALRDFWESNPKYVEAKSRLQQWWAEAEEATWEKPTDIKEHYGNASILKDNRVVFNICGNKYRLIVKINYAYGIIYVRFVGTHAQYDQIDPETI